MFKHDPAWPHWKTELNLFAVFFAGELHIILTNLLYND